MSWVEKNRTAKFYNIKTYLSGLFFVYKKSLSLIELKSGESLLDIGCGTGKILHQLEKKYGNEIKLFGIDPSPEMLQIAKWHNPKSKISFKIAFASDLPFINSSMDWVISTLAFHHMPEDEKRIAIGEAARILKPNGKLLISDFGRPKGIFGNIFAWLSKNHAHTKNNMEFVEQILKQNNFQVIKTAQTWNWIEHIIVEHKT